jgi:hypothetical protein
LTTAPLFAEKYNSLKAFLLLIREPLVQLVQVREREKNLVKRIFVAFGNWLHPPPPLLPVFPPFFSVGRKSKASGGWKRIEANNSISIS